MTYAATIAEGWNDVRTDRPLIEIAQDQAASRVLSPETRAYFADLADGTTDGTPEQRERAFFEAAASYSTRKGQSYARRVALGDLHRLHAAAIAGRPIPRDRYYATGLPVTIKVGANGVVSAHVDLTEAAAAVADSGQPGAVDDSAVVAASVATYGTTVVTQA